MKTVLLVGAVGVAAYLLLRNGGMTGAAAAAALERQRSPRGGTRRRRTNERACRNHCDPTAAPPRDSTGDAVTNTNPPTDQGGAFDPGTEPYRDNAAANNGDIPFIDYVD